MAYKIAALVALVAATAAVDIISSKTSSLDPPYTKLYHNGSTNGTLYFTNQPDISQTEWNKKINRTKSSGVWIYYGQTNYNALYPGQVTWTHGIDKDFDDMPAGYASSFRHAGSYDSIDEEGFTTYEGMSFTGAAFYGKDRHYNQLEHPIGMSLIITGASNWTFYTFTNYEGASGCAVPTNIDISTDKNRTLHTGFYPTLSHPWKNSIMSAKKGCHPDTPILTMEPLEV